jgi:homoserine O-acetyltransferase
MFRSTLKIAALAIAVVFISSITRTVLAYEGIVKKEVFTLPTYTTFFGKPIKNVRVGWEAYGTLNVAKDNAILVTHFYTGNSHAAGKYKPDDKAAGYWDSVIGAGKALDTNKYYVLSVDSLVNLNVKDPNTTTTGPASVNPDSGKPYGMSFPVVTIRDFVNVQKALLDSLGIKKLKAVVGASMGGLQAFEWGAAYPDVPERIVPVIAAPEANAFLIGALNIWAAPIQLDPKWKNGDYYGYEEPVAGLGQALKIVTLQARASGWADQTFGRKYAANQNPSESMSAKFLIEDTLDKAGTGRAAASDANSFLYLARANQLFVAGQGANLDEGLKRIKAKVLLIPASTDLLFPPSQVKQAQEKLRSLGLTAEYFELQGTGGHLDGIFQIAQADATLRAFLEK